MDRAELIALASPPCHECNHPVQRVETTWTRQGLDWVPNDYYMVCVEGHRIKVEFPDAPSDPEA